MLLEFSDVLEGLYEADMINKNISSSIGTGGGQENVDVVYGPSNWKIYFLLRVMISLNRLSAN